MTLIHAEEALLPTGWAEDVTVAIGPDGLIDSVGPAEGAPDHRVALLLPAPVNLHSHAFQRAMAGLTERRGPEGRDSFWTWRRLMYRFLDRLDPEQVEAVAALVFLEMLEAGYAGVAEFHYLHHAPGGAAYDDPAEMSARIAAAAETAGIGLTLLPVLYSRGGCDGRALEGGQRRFGCDAERFARLHTGAARTVAAGPADWRIGVAPHSLRAVDAAGLAAAQALAPEGPIHIHLAEQRAEVAEVEAHLGARPAQWLLDNAPVDARWCPIHCTQMQPEETARLAATGAVAGLCPITEASLGDGIFDGVRWRAAGGRLGIGSDSNVLISLTEELRMLDYGQRLRDGSRAALAAPGGSTGRALWEVAAAGGARAAGRDAGRIAAGAWADLVAMARDTPGLAGRRDDAALDSLVFACPGNGPVSEVWSAGRHIVTGGRHVRRAAILGPAMAALATLGAAV